MCLEGKYSMRPPTLEAAGQPAKNGMKLPIAPVSALNVRVLFAFDYPISVGLPTRLLRAIRLSHLSSVASSVDFDIPQNAVYHLLCRLARATATSHRAISGGVPSFSRLPSRSRHSAGGVWHFRLLVVTTHGASPSLRFTTGRSFIATPTT